MKVPADFLAKLLAKPTPEDKTEACKLGVSREEFRAVKLQGRFEPPKPQADESGASGPPDDSAAEQADAMRTRREPGIIKLRNTSPNILVQAAKTPGEVARMILFVICYFIGLVLLMTLGGERVTKMEGIVQCALLGVLIIPALWVSGRIVVAIGEGARDLFRTLVRFRPLTLLGLFFTLMIRGVLKRQLAYSERGFAGLPLGANGRRVYSIVISPRALVPRRL